MAKQRDGQLTRTVAKCDTCGSIYVAKISSDGSFYLDGLSECPCGDEELILPASSPGSIDQ